MRLVAYSTQSDGYNEKYAKLKKQYTLYSNSYTKPCLVHTT